MLILALWLLGDIMLPFIAGLVLAYFLDPVADALERLGLPRLAATLLILISEHRRHRRAALAAAAGAGRSDRPLLLAICRASCRRWSGCSTIWRRNG